MSVIESNISKSHISEFTEVFTGFSELNSNVICMRLGFMIV